MRLSIFKFYIVSNYRFGHAACMTLAIVSCLPIDASAAIRLRCHIEQSGEVKDLEFSPVTDPYSIPSIAINKNFRFKAVVIGDEHKVDYIKIYTYYQIQRQAMLLHEAKYLSPVAQIAPLPDSLTGKNFHYSPILGRELQYGCALFEVSP